MNNKFRPWALLAVALLIAACTAGESAAPSSTPPTTVATAPDATNPSPTTSSASSSETVIRPWGHGSVARGVELSLIVPDGWEIMDGFVVTGDDADGTHMRVGAGFIGNLFADRCQWSTTTLDPPLGLTVGDLATAFTTIWGSDATAPVDVAVDSFEGKYMVLTVPSDVDFADCDSQHFVGWAEAGSGGPSRWYQGPGQILEHWILDVDGVRLVIEASHFPELSDEGLAELQGIVDSIRIEPDAGS